MLTFLKNKYWRNRPMVEYWKQSDTTEGKVKRHKDGHYEMYIRGEKYPFPGVPRGALLYGKLSKLKHEIKNQVFNDSWALLEKGEEIAPRLRNDVFPGLFALSDSMKYDFLPFESLQPPVKELHRAMTKVGMNKWRDIIVFILQEDDAYRMRFQWMAKFYPRNPGILDFTKALEMLEHAEVVSDMKERVRLVRRVMLAILRDHDFRKTFDAFMREVDWKKVVIKESDKYFLRAKYFKTDYPEYAY